MSIEAPILVLLAGHFLGDFVLQSDSLVEKKAKSIVWRAVHVIVVSAVTWMLLGSWKAWPIIAAIFVCHLLIDSIKCYLAQKKLNYLSDTILFIGDQVVHIGVLILLWMALKYDWGYMTLPANCWVNAYGLAYSKLLILISGFSVGIWGIGIFLKHQMASFSKHLPKGNLSGIPDGGRTIGILERVFVLLFVLVGQPEAVGFVIAAKSVFRIGDLTKHADRKFAEYIMIGTLRSFTYSFVIAYAMKWLIINIK